LTHYATAAFWTRYRSLPQDVQRTADRAFAKLKENPRHPSLRLKKVGRMWSVRVGLRYRALAVESGDDLVWFWIGTHADYDKLTRQG
jgi:hypothetical protein